MLQWSETNTVKSVRSPELGCIIQTVAFFMCRAYHYYVPLLRNFTYAPQTAKGETMPHIPWYADEEFWWKLCTKPAKFIIGWIALGFFVVMAAEIIENQTVVNCRKDLSNASTPEELLMRLEDYYRALATRGVTEEHRVPTLAIIGQLTAATQLSLDDHIYWKLFASALIARDKLPSIPAIPGVNEWPWIYSPLWKWVSLVCAGFLVLSFILGNVFPAIGYRRLNARAKRDAETTTP